FSIAPHTRSMETAHGVDDLVGRPVLARPRGHRLDVRLRHCLRQGLKGNYHDRVDGPGHGYAFRLLAGGTAATGMVLTGKAPSHVHPPDSDRRHGGGAGTPARPVDGPRHGRALPGAGMAARARRTPRHRATELEAVLLRSAALQPGGVRRCLCPAQPATLA